MTNEHLFGIDLEIEDEFGTELESGTPVIKITVNDYTQLDNKPLINGRKIIGDKTVAYYLQDGLIIDGGDAGEGT